MARRVDHNVEEHGAPAVVERIVAEALARQASDLYWLPSRESVRIRARIGGLQHDMEEVPRNLGEQCLTHIKVLAGLLTYRTQVAQDGVMRRNNGEEIRVATMPTLYGERITMRMMARRAMPFQLDDLGYPAAAVESLRRMLMRPSGLIVLTGQTGCGKTTTIYALIRELLKCDQDPSSIITLEDPIESVIEEISQTAVTRTQPEWNYETALRAALRQDVKTLVVGEMRDAGVVRVVLDAALTGHRILTTYHAGDIASVYARMLHQGFEPFLIGAAITGVVAQRLVRGMENQPVPVAGVLEADDGWRDFIAAGPHLEALRREVGRRPECDLATQACKLRDSGTISAATCALLGQP